MLFRSLGHPHLRAESVKFFADGVVENATAALLDVRPGTPLLRQERTVFAALVRLKLIQGALLAFALPAFAPNLMNLCVMAALGLAFLFPNAGYAASWGVSISGALELGLLMWGARQIGVLQSLRKPHSG